MDASELGRTLAAENLLDGQRRHDPRHKLEISKPDRGALRSSPGIMTNNTNPQNPSNDSQILRDAAERLRSHAEYMQGIIDESKRQKEADSRKGYFVGIAGCTLPTGEVEGFTSEPIEGDDPAFTLRPVTNPPDLGSLSRALLPQIRSSYTKMEQISREAKHELYISQHMADTPQSALNVAYKVISLMRLKAKCQMTGISFSRTPWGQVAAHENDVYLQPLEEPRKPLWPNSREISKEDFSWALTRLLRDLELWEEPSYRLAYDAAGDAPFLRDARTAMARIWSGIESIFDVQNELNFRLSMYSAVLISDDIEERIEIQKRFKRLYTMRSKAVHGSKLDTEKLMDALESSWDLLRDILIACIHKGPFIPLPSELDLALLGQKLSRDGGVSPEET